MSLTLGSQTPGQLGGGGLARVDRSIPPAFSRRRGRARRRGSGSPFRRPFGRRRPRERSPRSRASSGTRGRLRGRRSSPEQSSGRRPEFGLEREHSYGARGGRREGGTGAEAHGGGDGMVNRLGDESETTDGRRRSRAADDEDDGDGGSSGHSGLRGSARR